MADPSGRDRLERDFLSEAEEILERLDSDLGGLEDDAAAGRETRPDRLQAVFRKVHSLKGLAASFEVAPLAGLAHDLEDLLDRLRSGTAAVDGEVLDLMHAAVEALGAMVAALGDGRPPAEAPADLAARLRHAGSDAAAGASSSPDAIPLEPALFAALSRHEEDRLRTCWHAGRAVSLVDVALQADRFDVVLRSLVEALGTTGEVMATIARPGENDRLRFTILHAGEEPPDAGAAPLLGLEARVAILRRTASPDGDAAGAPPAAAGPGKPRGGEGSEPAQGAATLRVPVARLDDLLLEVGEMSIAFAALERAAQAAREAHPDDRAVREAGRRVRDLEPRIAALRRGVLGARLVPLSQVFGRLGGLVARAARAAGKEATLHTLGGDTAIDKAVMDGLASPLGHLMHNALAHGIEPREERAARGKPRRGRIVVSAFQQEGRVILDVSDDGRGISIAAVRAAAESRGLARPGEAWDAARAAATIFSPGFSTAPTVSAVAGRGVGLDAVAQAIRDLKGSVRARTIEGQGTTFTITVPISLAIVPALIVVAGARRFAIPCASIRRHLALEPSRIRRERGVDTYAHEGGALRLVRLAALMQEKQDDAGPARYAVIAGGVDGGAALVVDAFAGRRDLVVKPLGAWARELPWLKGAADLGDATPVLVIDPEALAARESPDVPA